MRIILTAKQTFKSKTGQEYVKCSFIDATTGETGELFSSAEQYRAYGLPEDRIMDAKTVQQIDWPVADTEAEFNQKGRLVSLK